MKRKRVFRFATIFILLLAVAGAVCWWRLPGLIEAAIERRLADEGYPGSRLHVESVGLGQLELSAVSVGAGSWQLRIGKGTVDYRALELVQGQVRDAVFEGVRFELELAPVASIPQVAAVHTPVQHDQLRQALAQLPVRSVVVTNGLIQLRRAEQELGLPFGLRWTNDTTLRQLRAQTEFGLEEGEWAGYRLRQATLEAAASLSVAPSVGSQPVGALMDWIERQQPGLISWLRQAAFELQFSAGQVELANRSIFSNALIRLDRSEPPGSGAERMATFSAEVAAVECDGIVLSEAWCSGEITGDGLRVDGSARLEEAPVDFRFEVTLMNRMPAGPELAGAFTFGTVRLDAFTTPHAWTGGQTILLSGELDGSGRFEWTPETGTDLWPEVRFALERMEWRDAGMTVEGVRGSWSGAVTTLPAADANVIHVDRIRYGDYEVTELALRIARTGDLELEIELMNARLLGGRVRVPPVRWNPQTAELEVALELERISLRSLADLIPHFAGSIEGGLSGRLPLRWDEDGFAVGAAILRLDRSQSARLRYPAKGILTRGTTPGSDRFKQLQLVEAAMEDLRLTDLAIELYPPDQPQTPIRLRLEGTFSSDKAVVPVKFNLNLNGDLDPIWRLWRLGEIDLEL